LFHELRLAADLLSDPTQRASFDSLLNARNARKLRFSALDNKRKSMAEDLERREKEFKRRKEGEDSEMGRKKSELERLKEEGRRMREVREKEQEREEREGVGRRKEEEKKKREVEKRIQGQRDGVVELGPLDKTIRLKWVRSIHPTLITSESITDHLSQLLKPNKLEIESIVISSKTLSGKGKYGSGVVSFKSLSAAVRVVKGKRKMGEEGEWKGFEVDWASGSPPAVLGDEEGVESMSAKPPPPPTATKQTSNETLLSAVSASLSSVLVRPSTDDDDFDV